MVQSSSNTTTVERQERISDLISTTKHSYMNVLVRLYDDVKRACKSNKFILRDFQLMLKGVSTWSDSRKRDEVNRFEVANIQTMLNDILMMNHALFNSDSPANRIVKASDFIYANMLNVAREVWTKPFLLYHRVNKQEYQKNLLGLEKLVIGEIKSTVRKIDKMTTHGAINIPLPLPLALPMLSLPMPMPLSMPAVAPVPDLEPIIVEVNNTTRDEIDIVIVDNGIEPPSVVAITPNVDLVETFETFKTVETLVPKPEPIHRQEIIIVDATLKQKKRNENENAKIIKIDAISRAASVVSDSSSSNSSSSSSSSSSSDSDSDSDESISNMSSASDSSIGSSLDSMSSASSASSASTASRHSKHKSKKRKSKSKSTTKVIKKKHGRRHSQSKALAKYSDYLNPYVYAPLRKSSSKNRR